MKKSFPIILVTLLLTACSLDNYDAPSSLLTGTVTYNGNPVYLDGGAVTFNLFQDGYEKQGPITVSVASDGTFSALVFDGSYHLQNIDNNGPWTNDVAPVDIVVKGDTKCNVEVTPYFVLENTSIVLNGDEVKGLCSIRQVATGKSAKQIFMVVGRTPFLNDQSYSYLARKSSTTVKVGGSQTFSIATDDIDASESDYLYARIGLEINGLNKFIYTETIRIK